MTISSKIIIAIDGPAGAGKSTTAVQVAQQLNLLYIDTGAMYRAMALHILHSGVDQNDMKALHACIDQAEIELVPRDKALSVVLNGTDVSEAIRTPEITAASSPLSQIPRVRQRLIALQRTMGAAHGAVLEGRDIGTVVFPHADLKIFLTASVAERATRRFKDLTAQGATITLAEVTQAIQKRDDQDTNRAESPLKPALDAQLLNTTDMTLPEQIAEIVAIAKERT